MLFDERRVGLAFPSDPTSLSYDDKATVSQLVREALVQGGLGVRSPLAPLADVIEPGMTVLLKPNWVLHLNQGGHGMDCMVTHPVFIEAVLIEVLKAKPGRVVIADAPIQDADFEALVPLAWQEHVKRLGGGCPVEIADLRLCVRRTQALGGVHVERSLRPEDAYILFDLQRDSLLDPISTPSGRFRNTNYDPDVLIKTHRPGCHKYLLSRIFFEADVVINLPKLKTHRKAGITAALKNLVGINGDKDYLPHHRIGGSKDNGDCYEGRNILKRATELFNDLANRRINSAAYLPLKKMGWKFMRLNRRFFSADDEIEGGWYGNDTVWRMVLDLNRLALHGRTDGSLSEKPVRRIYSLTDAIVAGEGLGPLSPEPLRLGAVSFASSSAFADVGNAALLRLDWRKIPLVRQSFEKTRFSLTASNPEEIDLRVNGSRISLEELAQKRGLPSKPPRGWQGRIELR